VTNIQISAIDKKKYGFMCVLLICTMHSYNNPSLGQIATVIDVRENFYLN
jgi:hypothetical protein